MAVLRPSPFALARRLGTAQQQCLDATSRPFLLSILHSRVSLSPKLISRPFSLTSPCAAKVSNPTNTIPAPQRPTPPQKKRTVRIGFLPNGPVRDETIRRIFGPRVAGADGNNILRIIHHRRTSGSLADYGVANLGKKYSNISYNSATKALEWLRETYPIDEAQAAEQWAEREANRISYELWLADPENESKYKDPARAFREQQKEAEEREKEEAAQETRRIGMLRVGPSEFDRNTEEQRRKRLEEVTKKAEEKEKKAVEEEKLLATGEWVRTPGGTQLMKPDQTTYVDIFGREQVSRRKEMLEKYQKKAQTPFKNEEEMLAHTTLGQRLYPMTAFVLVTLFLSWGFAHFYQPPSPEYRLYPDLSPTTATYAAIVAANVMICIAWRFAPFWPIMMKYFMHIPGSPRAVQSVLNVFSHVQYDHLLSNMMMFSLVGPVCHDLVGRGIFLGTYVSAGAMGTLFTLYWANLGRGAIAAHSVGASAAIWGISALYCLLTEQDKLTIPFVKDMEISFWPKMLFVAFFGMEIATAVKGKAKLMDHASHFGGIAVGASVAGYLRVAGFHQRREGGATAANTATTDAVQQKAGVGDKTVDVGAIVKEEANEIKESVSKILK